jgi:glutathione S-transferase
MSRPIPVTELTLHDYELDDGCYKVRLLLGALGLQYTKVAVDVYPGREQLSAKYLKLNPLGGLPILVDVEVVLHGPEAILAYLAQKCDSARTWLPQEPETFGAVMMWLGFAGGELRAASLARLHHMLEVEADAAAVDRQSRQAFCMMDDHMTLREFDGAKWFVGSTPTVADIALFPAIALSRDFGIEHEEYPSLRRWMRRVRKIPGFVTMPGIPSYH